MLENLLFTFLPLDDNRRVARHVASVVSDLIPKKEPYNNRAMFAKQS